MDIQDRVKLFGMSHSLVERDLDHVEKRHSLDLQRSPDEGPRDQDYYPQFDHALRVEAASMSLHYELFYCLEKSIRQLIAETLRTAHGDAWWASHVPQGVRDNAALNIKREAEEGVTPRSEQAIDYTTFGELGLIVRKNWADFGSLFTTERAFSKVMTRLNHLRGPIAHCSPLAADEALRLELTLRDWFRLME